MIRVWKQGADLRDGGGKVTGSWVVEAGVKRVGGLGGGRWESGDGFGSVRKQRGQAQAEGEPHSERRQHREVKRERPDCGGLHRAGK